MTCFQNTSATPAPPGAATYQTQAACLEACKEGACCETANGATACTVKPQCQCQGTGKVFKGVGTTCADNPCEPCKACPGQTLPESVTITVEAFEATTGNAVSIPLAQLKGIVDGTYVCQRVVSPGVTSSQVAYEYNPLNYPAVRPLCGRYATVGFWCGSAPPSTGPGNQIENAFVLGSTCSPGYNYFVDTFGTISAQSIMLNLCHGGSSTQEFFLQAYTEPQSQRGAVGKARVTITI